MQWHTVTTTRSLACQLINDFWNAGPEFLSKNPKPSEHPEVYHKEVDFDTHIYYFSPSASLIGEELLRSYNAVPCLEEPNLEGFRKITDL